MKINKSQGCNLDKVLLYVRVYNIYKVGVLEFYILNLDFIIYRITKIIHGKGMNQKIFLLRKNFILHIVFPLELKYSRNASQQIAERCKLFIN